MKLCADDTSDRRDTHLIWTVSIAACLALACFGPAAFAASAESADLEPPRVYTNDDLPDLNATPATRPDAATSASIAAALPVLDHPEITGAISVAFHRLTAGAQLTVPELLLELDHLQRRRLRLFVPFLSRRFAAALPEEREAEQGLDNRAISAQLLARQEEVTVQLNEAGVDIPSRGFGQHAPLLLPGLTESPRFISSIVAGPVVRQDTVARAEGLPQFKARAFRKLEESTAFVTAAEFRDSRPDSVFLDLSEELSVTQPH